MQQLIYDRTEQDKGKLNAPMLTRIEAWTSYLSSVLEEHGYFASIDMREEVWQMSDIPTYGDIDRIRRNVDALQAGFYSLPDWREIVHNNTMDYIQANALEWDLQILHDWLQRMCAAFAYSGEVYGGEI